MLKVISNISPENLFKFPKLILSDDDEIPNFVSEILKPVKSFILNKKTIDYQLSEGEKSIISLTSILENPISDIYIFFFFDEIEN